MSIREFFDWQTFAATHPLPADLIDVHAARFAAMFASVHRAEGAAAPAVRDFLLIRDRAPAAPRAHSTGSGQARRMTEAQRMRAALAGG